MSLCAVRASNDPNTLKTNITYSKAGNAVGKSMRERMNRTFESENEEYNYNEIDLIVSLYNSGWKKEMIAGRISKSLFFVDKVLEDVLVPSKFIAEKY